tara:strand:- start:325 stop:888 length:564 start_codon:yes stop_codon:yes gene_type:complete
MRIISGKFKNKKILEPLDKQTRPLKDITKESIFNILKHSKLIKFEIENCSVLDLFSGSGSFGLECISRGAKKVVFCENYQNALKILEKNINILQCEEYAEVIRQNSFEIFSKVEFNEKFEIIFLDPPFKEEKIEPLLDTIKERKVLHNNGVIILHRNKKKNDLPKNCNVILEKVYGLSKIYFLNFNF